MRDKSTAEQNAATRQVELISNALERAKTNESYWLNVAGRFSPSFYPKGVSVSSFNSLTLGLHSEENGYKSAFYTTFREAKNQGASVLAKQKGAPFIWYNWKDYVNRNNPDDKITRADYLKLPSEEKKQFKGIHNREIFTLFNLDQTTLPLVDKERYQKILEQSGCSIERLHTKNEETKLRISVNDFILKMRDNLVPVKRDTSGVARYDTTKDVVYMPEQKHFAHYHDYIQEMLRQVVTATGHQQRLAREGMVMDGAKAPSEDAEKYERLIAELSSGIKMQEMGLPSKISNDNIQLIDYWQRELRENPCLIDAIESDVNNALDAIHRAEDGQRIVYKTEINQQEIQHEREKQRPKVDSHECAIMLDIIRQGGMRVDDRNFASPEDKEAFLKKFSLEHYENEKNYGLSKTDSDDPDVVDLAYTKAVKEGSRMSNVLSEYMPSEWNVRSGRYAVADTLHDIPNKDTREMVIVKDMKTGLTDVILPACAATGGFVVMSADDKRPFHLTPDEVMSEAERNEANAKIERNDLPGFNKERIEAALMKSGSSYVRFYNNDGSLGYRPDDHYFENKDVGIAKLKGWELKEISKLDVSEAVKQVVAPSFEQIQMLRDDKGRWAMYLKPENEDGFSVYPDKADLNQFFSTIKQGQMEEGQQLRNELALKYHVLVQNKPELKVDLFDLGASKEDTDRISRVSIYRTKDTHKLYCLPKIEGMDDVKEREITQEQWQKIWLAKDINEYKKALAARIYADVLHPERHIANENTISEKMLAQFDSLKAKHPDALLLFRVGDNYQSYKQDVASVQKALGLEKAETVKEGTSDKVDMVSFPTFDLDRYLPKLIRSGNRVAICDPLEEPKQAMKETANEKVREENSEENIQRVRTGMRM
ncbi:DNA mismatch repair protein MutS [Bacteroides sp. HPS0048]|uniref:zincin-like metallopeptidase domain-containing protein n=1 Tax=Bacteroides sp. HPS0048 TaxID=1078089 RepID=UPI000374E250|nr:ArdC-like ssDNA-binding domain-containing protein [Bacteroides sp. HPS0048]EOA58501.1 DNA mismatch repair protein MutS [Bacteroides sp. HPS0048]